MLSLQEKTFTNNGRPIFFNSGKQPGKYFFRLIIALYLVFLINPGQYIKIRELPAAEYGIGGGYFSQEYISEEESEIMLTPAAFESVLLEPDSLTKPRFLLYDSYMVQSGDNISTLAITFGLNQDTIVSVNKVTNSRLLQAGRTIRIPNQDGIFHTVSKDDTLDSLAEQYGADKEAIKIINELFSDKITAGTDLFIPAARLDWSTLQEINGDLFIWPVNGAITSLYGYRRDPFNRNITQFHNGIDIRGNIGTPIRAAMAGRISVVGYDNVYGHYIVINHHSGYRTLYGHLSVIRTRTGAYVTQGERIGDVGNTGLSTGPHLHFTVYKNGVTINPRPLMR
ncbi:MAG: M23 family metallopeptidase [Treponema sp.]|jgi:murein DD-endopeptidase MepM/ murein hydrolase activator NlpD|nr:M23 family metallopeptidase [Treponema sp.]